MGDTVILRKAGDVIPEIVSVMKELRPKEAKPYQFPKRIAECGGDGAIERIPGMAAYRCVAKDSAILHRRRLYYFVSKGALNIDGVGPRIIDLLLEHKLINTASDLFTLKKGDLLPLPGFKEKSAQNVIDSIDARRKVPLNRFLVALSIDHVGEETARIIAEAIPSIGRIRRAARDELSQIHGVGEIVADSIIAWFKNPHNLKECDALLSHIEVESDIRKKQATKLTGKTVVFTGTLRTIGRTEAENLARNAGATVSSSVSKKTDYVIAGEDPGSKAQRAEALGVQMIEEAEFKRLIGKV
jgi:DNA ligase (NAD+)